MKFGLLDFGFTLEATIACAKRADELGYSRYWLTEHHDVNDPWASSEIPLAIVGAATARIRIGSAGVLLNSHNPLRVACDFALLSNLFPNRVDLGFARGRPTVRANANALGNAGCDAAYEERVLAVVELFRSKRDAGDEGALCIPASNNQPQFRLLGSGSTSLNLAVRYGLEYTHALFFTMSQLFRSGTLFKPGAQGTLEPLARIKHNFALSVICGETERELARLVEDNTTGFLPNICGTPDRCIYELKSIADELGAEELILVDLSASKQDRLKTIENLKIALDHRADTAVDEERAAAHTDWTV